MLRTAAKHGPLPAAKAGAQKRAAFSPAMTGPAPFPASSGAAQIQTDVLRRSGQIAYGKCLYFLDIKNPPTVVSFILP